MKIRPTLAAPLQAFVFLAAALLVAVAAHAQTAVDEPTSGALAEQARQLALHSARPAAGLRVDVEVGSLDPRLKLAPCQQIDTYLPPGFKPWGKTRVGLRCLQGPVRWSVFLPVTVKVFGPAVVAASALPAGSTLGPADLTVAETDLAADAQPALLDPAPLIGRTLSRTVNAGEGLRQGSVKARQYFAAGDTVQLWAVGDGYSVQSEGQALSPGLEGSAVRVRTDSGRIVTGMPVADRRVELTL